MSSYGAIGIDYNEYVLLSDFFAVILSQIIERFSTEPLVTEEPPLPRSASTSQIGREQYSNRRQPYMFTGW